MPLKKDVIGRFKHMAPDIKSRKDRLKKISKEVKLLWTEQLNFLIGQGGEMIRGISTT